jgi:hypothetical protein
MWIAESSTNSVWYIESQNEAEIGWYLYTYRVPCYGSKVPCMDNQGNIERRTFSVRSI